MKNLLISDLHLTVRDSKFIEVDGFKYPEKLFNKISIIQNIIDDFQKKYPNEGRIIICGDIFHEKRYVYDLALKLFIDILANCKLDTYIISGNHDTTSRGNHNYSLLSWIKSLPHMDHIHLIEPNNYEVIDNIALVSWSKNMKQVLGEFIEDNDMFKINILVSHFGVDDALVSSGIYIKSDLKFSDIAKAFKLILLGHYHKPQEIKKKNSTLYYVGSVIQESWGESGEQKRYLIVDNETLEVTSHVITGYRKYVTIETDDIDECKKLLKEVSEDDYIRVKTNTNDINSLCMEQGIPCVYTKPEIDLDSTQIQTIDEKLNDIYKGYLNKMEIEEEKHPEYLKILNKIIEG